MRLAAVLTALAFVLAACGSEGPTMPPEVADGLAAQADAIAATIDGGDGCAARQQIDALRGDVTARREAGDLDVALADELISALDDLERQISCSPPPDDDEEAGDEEEKERDEGEGEGRGNGPPPGRGGDD